MRPRYLAILLAAAVLSFGEPHTSLAQVIIPGSKEGAVRGGFAPQRPLAASSGSVGVLGEIHHPGVYRLTNHSATLGDALRWSGNLTPQANGDVRLLRGGTVQKLDLSARSLGMALRPADVVLFDRSGLPETSTGTKLVRTDTIASNPASHTVADDDVLLAFVGLFDRPVVARVRAEDATIGNLIIQLGQSSKILSTTRVIAPGKVTVDPTSALSDRIQLVSGSVLLFEPSALQHDRLPPPPPELEPESSALLTEGPRPHDLGVAEPGTPAGGTETPNEPLAAIPRIEATFVTSIEEQHDEPHTTNASGKVQSADMLTETEVASSGGTLATKPGGIVYGASNSQFSALPPGGPEQSTSDFNLHNALEPSEQGIDINNGAHTTGTATKKDFAIHLDSAFDEPSSGKNRRDDKSLLKKSNFVPWIIGGLAGGALLLICAAMFKRFWSQMRSIKQELQPDTVSLKVPAAVSKTEESPGGQMVHAQAPEAAVDPNGKASREALSRAKQFAQRAVAAIRQGAQFSFLRRANGDDGTRQSSGDPTPIGLKQTGSKVSRRSKSRASSKTGPHPSPVKIKRRDSFIPADRPPEPQHVLNAQSAVLEPQRERGVSKNAVVSISPTEAVAVKHSAAENRRTSENTDAGSTTVPKPHAPTTKISSHVAQGTSMLGRALSQLQARGQT